MLHLLNLLVPFLLLSDGAATASPEAHLRAEATKIPCGRVFHADHDNASLWSRGDSYKARFGADGATYFPAFGPSAPRHFPVTFGESAFTLDGEPWDVGIDNTPHRNGDTVLFERGPVVERWALTPNAMEHTIELAALPARGELVVRVPVVTDMAARNGSDGVEFTNELGIVHYSRALVFDADGRSEQLETFHDGDAIVMRVPAAFLRDAVLPVTIDPLVSTIAVDTSSSFAESADVCFDQGSSRFTVVYRITVTSADHDVFLRQYTAAGALVVSSDAFVDTSNDDWSKPSIANLNETDSNLIVANVLVSGTGHVLKAVPLTSLGVGTTVTLPTGPAPSSAMNVRIGGDPVAGSGQTLFCVVWDRRTAGGSDLSRDVFARCLTSTGAPFGTANIILDNTPSQDDRDPSISRSNDGASWIVAWERNVSATNGDILAARIGADGTLEALPYPVEVNSVNYRNPEVSSRIDGTNRYLVVVERVFTDGSSDVFADMMNGSVKENGTTINFADGTPNSGQGSPDDVDPQVSCDGRHFAITYAEAASVGSTNLDVYVTDWLQTDGELRLAESRVLLAGSSTEEQRPRMASVHSGGSTGRRHMIVWDDNDRDIEGAIYESVEGGAWSAYCFGDGSGTSCPCGNIGAHNRGCPNSINVAGAQLDVLGTVSTTSDDAQLRGRFMPANSSCLYFQGTTSLSSGIPPFGTGVVFGDGLRCTGGSVFRLAQVANSSAGSSLFPATTTGLDLHISSGIPATGTRRFYQIWYRNAAVFCTTSTFNLTNGVVIDWTP